MKLHVILDNTKDSRSIEWPVTVSLRELEHYGLPYARTGMKCLIKDLLYLEALYECIHKKNVGICDFIVGSPLDAAATTNC